VCVCVCACVRARARVCRVYTHKNFPNLKKLSEFLRTAIF